MGEEAANPAIGHETFLNLASLFIDRCAPKQLRVNPDKCAAPSHSLLAPPPYPPPACPHAELMRGTVRMYSPQSRASHGG